MIDRKYIPPDIPGYVHYSNHGTCRYGSMRLETKEDVMAIVLDEFKDAAPDDVLVMDFLPDGPIEGQSWAYRTRWASYLTIKHREDVESVRHRIETLLNALKLICGDMWS